MRMADDTSLLPRDESLEAFVDLSEATGELPALDSTEFNKALRPTSTTTSVASRRR